MKCQLFKLLCSVISLAAAFATTMFKTLWRTPLSRMRSSCTECAAVVMHHFSIKSENRSSNMTYIPIKIFASNQGCDTPWQMPLRCMYVGRKGQKIWQYFNLQVLCTSERNYKAYCSYNSLHRKYLCQPYKIITIQLSWKKAKTVIQLSLKKTLEGPKHQKGRIAGRQMYSEEGLDISDTRKD